MKTLWFDAMQADVAAEVHIITDDLSGLYVIFCAQNDPHYPCMLGKMDPEHETTKLYQLAFTEFLRNL